MVSKNATYWITLSLVLGYNTPKIKQLHKLYPDISWFLRAGENEWRRSGVLANTDINKLAQANPADSERILARCRELGYSVLALDDEAYPESLYHIYAPPAVLYVSGELPDFNSRLSIGVVGTRTASRYGTENSYKIAYSLAKYGTVIVSGGALGVDCASHRGSLAADGVTVCVRGCGINDSYLHENRDMRRAIIRKGAVVSEYPPDEPPRKYYFPARNRIIAALSDGVLLIEAGEKSGSLITANMALDMGKELFALLGNNNYHNTGSNRLIKDGLAIPVTDFMDILVAFDNLEVSFENIGLDSISLADIEAIPVKAEQKTAVKRTVKKSASQKPTAAPKTTKKEINLTGDEKAVYDYLTAEPVHIDTIAGALSLPVSRALSALTLLEIKGLIVQKQSRNFGLKQ